MLNSLKTILESIATACKRCKSPDVSSDTTTILKRCLSTLDLTFIGVGGTLGSAVYVLSGQLARNTAGPGLVISYAIAAIASIFSAVCYIELCTKFPKAGSAYVYCYVALGEFFAFTIGWNILLEYMIGTAVVTKAASNYIDSFANEAIQNITISLIGEMKVTGLSNYFDLLSFTVILVFSLVNALGIKTSSRFSNILSTLNILTILVATFAGFGFANASNWSNFAPFGFKGIVRASSTCFYAFIGFDLIACISEEAKDPTKSVPISILGTLLICFLLYVGSTASLTLMVPYYELNTKTALSYAFTEKNSIFLAYAVAVGALVSIFNCILTGLNASPRFLYSLAKDGLLPYIFARVNSKTDVPVISTMFVGVLTGFIAAILDFKSLADMLSIGALLAYSSVNISLLVLRYRVATFTESDVSGELRDMSTKRNPCKSILKMILHLRESQTYVNVSIFLIVVGIVITCIVADKYFYEIFETGNPLCIFIWILLLLVTLSCGIFLHLKKTRTEGQIFCAPLLPWTPMIALVFNIYLMLELNILSWIRFGIWMAIGIFVYFAYSMHHSVEKDNTDGSTDFISLYSGTEDGKSLDKTCEKTALLMKTNADD